MNSIRATGFEMLASDLDGTLLNIHGNISTATIAQLRRIHALGVVCVAATGRSQYSAVEKLEPAGVFRWLVTSNGAGLYDFDEGKLIETAFLEASEVGPIVERIQNELPGCGFSWETSEGIYYDQTYGDVRLAIDARDPYLNGSVGVFEPGREELAKILVVHSHAQGKNLADRLRLCVGDGVNLQSSGLTFMEITSKVADKSIMLARLCVRLGIEQAQTVVFGDQLNDRGMLEWAGRSYLMSNGDPDLAKLVHARCPSNSHDGVARTIESLWPH